METCSGQVGAQELLAVVRQRRIQVRGAVLAPVEDTTYLALDKKEVIAWLESCEDECRFNVFTIGNVVYIG